ncbi:MAG: hypothetical protein AAGK04_08230 [Planctomycetota bacterium]
MKRLVRATWLVLTLRCEEADRLRSARSADELTPSERLAERVHSALCTSCRRARRQIEMIDEAMRDLRRAADEPGEVAPMPREARDRIDRTLRARRGDSSG